MNTTFIAGPCVIESAELLDTVAARLTEINRRLGVQIIFKASFDKANRTSIRSYRGVGMEKGLQMLADVRSKWGLRLLTDSDSGLPLPPDRPSGRRSEDGAHGQHQEGAVPLGRRHALPL